MCFFPFIFPVTVSLQSVLRSFLYFSPVTLFPPITNSDNVFQHEDCDVGRIMSKLYTFSDLARFTQCQRVFYNRVPKCGSRTVLSTFKILARALHYKVESVERYGRSSYIGNVSLMVSQLHRQRLIDGESITSATYH